MRKETTAKVAPETNIYENNGDGSLSEDTNNAVTNSNRDRAGSVKEDTCSTAVLGNEAQETDLNENTGTGGHESKGDGSLNRDTDMNGGHEIEGDNSLKEDTNNTVTNSNCDRAGSVKEDTCSTGVFGNEAQETDLNENTGTGGHESKGHGSLNGHTDMNGCHESEGDASLGSVKEDTCSTAVFGNEAHETYLNENTGTGGHESKGDGSLNGDTDMNGGHESEGDDSLSEDTNNYERDGSVKEDTWSTAVFGNKEQETDLNENTGTGCPESKGDGSNNKDRNSKTGSFGSDSEKILTDQSKGDASLTEEIEKNVTNERKGEGSINEDINMTGKELEGVTNESEGDSLITDDGNSNEAVRKELISTNESHVDQVVREDTIEKDESGEIVHGLSEIQVEIAEKEATANNAKEKVESSVVDSSDDENLPLSELKILSSKRHDKGQVDSQIYFTSDSCSALEGTEYNEGNGNTIDRIIERLNDSEDSETHPMSMEEYRLTYDKEFFEGAVLDDEAILKDARSEVGSNIFSQSDTSVTATSENGNVSSDSEPELIIYRNKSNKKKKKLIYDAETMTYLVSAAQFGFPLEKILPDELREQCLKQDWGGIEIKSGLKEGRGGFAKKYIKKNDPFCNYGGVQVSRSYAEKYLLPNDEKCNYLVELVETTSSGMELFINCDSKRDKTCGQLINHSSLHPNAIPRTYATAKGKLDIIFCAQRDIKSGEEILWDYGKNYNGVEPCVESCMKCKGAVTKS